MSGKTNLQIAFTFLLMTLGSCTYHIDKIPLELKDVPSPMGGAFAIDFANVQKFVLQPACISCHATGSRRKPPLNKYAEVFDTVVAGKPEQSPLYLSLKQLGGRMPNDNTMLTKNQVMWIEEWIKAGAPEKAVIKDPTPTDPTDPTPPPDEEEIEPTFTALGEKVFKKYCYACHTGDDADHFMDISKYGDVVGNSFDPLIVVPGEPEKSKLYTDLTTLNMPRKLKGEPAPRVISESAKKAVYEWIKNGALNN